ncbi:MAG: hypothetical protein J7J99_05100, partial [Thermoprotei archaeon]|nr:hypothetical protein [Thermoprotei archaeon]
VVGTTVEVNVANVKFKILGTGCIVNLTINDELFLLYSGYAFWPDSMNGLLYYIPEYSARFLRVDVPKVEPFANGIIVKTYAKVRDPKIRVYGVFTVYSSGMIVVNITYVAWNITTMEWPGVRNLYPYPEFNGLKCLAIADQGSIIELPHDDQQGSRWGGGWVGLGMPSPTIPNTYLVCLTLLPRLYDTSELRSYSDIPVPPWYTRQKIFAHVIREYGSSWSGASGDSLTYLYVLYPHTKGETFTRNLLTIGWKLDRVINSVGTTSVHVKLSITKRMIEDLSKNIENVLDKLGVGDISTTSSMVDNIYRRAKFLWLTESYYELLFLIIIPSAILFGLVILIYVRTMKHTKRSV